MKTIYRMASMMAGSLLCLGSFSGPVLAVDVGPNVAVSTRFGDQTEPSIAVDPTDPNHLVAGAIDVSVDGCRFYVSVDGGNTWNTGPIIADVTRPFCNDPSLAFDSAGNIYYAGFFFDKDFSGSKINTAICVAKSVDGGNTYATPVCIPGQFGFLVDKPDVAVDTTGGPGDGTVYVAYNTVSFNDNQFRPILIGFSTNGGANFTFRTVEGIGNNTFAHAAVGPDGEIYVSWRRFNPSEIRIAKSTNGGVGPWVNKARVADIGDQDPNANVQGTFRTTRYPITGVSPRGEVFVVFADDPPLFSSFDSPLIPPPADPRGTRFFGINNAGWTVGRFFGQRENGLFRDNGFLHTPFTDMRIVVAPDGDTTAFDINDANQIVGSFFDLALSRDRGFLLDGNGFSTTLGFLPAQPFDFPGAEVTVASGINNRDQIVGWYRTQRIPSPSAAVGFLREVDGQFTTIEIPGAIETLPRGINDAGEIVGCFRDAATIQHGFIFRDQQFTTIDVPGASETCAFDINKAGKIVGTFDPGVVAPLPSFLRDENGAFTTIEFPDVGSRLTDSTSATGINDVDEIVGHFIDGSPGAIRHGFLAYARASQNIWLSRSAGNRCDAGDNVTRTCSTHADCPNGICVEGGSVWSDPARINDNTDGDQFDPWMYVAPAGRIHVSWLDRRNDPNNFFYETFYATSANGGLTFSPNERIATVASDPRGAIFGGFIGDYTALDGAGDTVFPAWPDMRDGIGDQNIYSARVECGLVDDGDGTITDTCTDLMWLQDANFAQTSGFDADGAMPWSDAMQWAENLVFVGYDDWRLPNSLGFSDPNCQAGATLSISVNCIGSEMGHLFFVREVSSTAPGVFTNITPRGTFYWSGTEFNPNRAWVSNFFFGEMGAGNKPSDLSAWAVRDIKLTDTRTGSPATVNPHPDVSVTFQAVTEGGDTTVVASTMNPGPTSFQFLGTFYDISTTATVTFPVTVCLVYEESDIPMGQSESDLQITHLVDVNMTPMNPNDDAWIIITDAGFPDTANNIICGTDSSLSSFAPALSDTTPPDLSLSVSPTVLWPPNHNMIPIAVTVSASDAGDPDPTVALVLVRSNEGDTDETFDPEFDVTEIEGRKGNDIQLIDGQLFLRTERSGNSDGRVYTITYEATDASGNSTTATATVEVPHNQ